MGAKRSRSEDTPQFRHGAIKRYPSELFFCPRAPSVSFRNRRAGRLFRWRGGRRYVLFNQVPNHCREQEGDQLRAPVLQRQSDEQDGDQLRAQVFRDRSFHNCCATKISAICWRNVLNQSQTGFNRRFKTCDLPWRTRSFETCPRGIQRNKRRLRPTQSQCG